MMLQDLPISALVNIISFLPQNDTLTLCHTSKFLHTIASQKLYRNIAIQRTPVLRTNKWYIDSTYTYITTPRNPTSKEAADYVLMLKLERLLESLNLKVNKGEKSVYADSVHNFMLFNGSFHDFENGLAILNQLIVTLKQNCENMERFHNSQDGLIHVDFHNLTHDTIYVDPEHENTTYIPNDKESLTIQAYQGKFELDNVESLASLKELVIFDEELASLRIFGKISAISPTLRLANLQKLSLCHIHDLHDHTDELRPLNSHLLLDLITLEQITELELTIGCTVPECPCLGAFVDELTPHLKSLRKISLNEKTVHKDHYHTENWDVAILRMLINMPCVSKLTSLTINHDTPKYGSIENGVDGNYFRRRRLYESVFSKFTSLQTFVSNTMLLTASCYELLTSDLLWNGCECKYCLKYLPYLDEYLMNHGIKHDYTSDKFHDMLSPKLFHIIGIELLHRVPALGELSTLDYWKFSPCDATWGFHGYDQITCYEDYECKFNDSWFHPSVVCVSHFFRDILRYCKKDLPQLRTVALSNVYFNIDLANEGEVQCIYDNEQ
ncbi:hypothetical protein WICPIJ_002780 [Wickerhamomyces pijperi]|uniref:F-box domain-containing protein n=1 Tax=Wickerhamomyces pijperi TaxID=599730 RepID=A0A9P8QB64_WICPI|nr:hypothetical protein WICPIJ_002780 [Wickerhamomyces pijperi]